MTRDEAVAKLRGAGLRVTPQRLAVLSALDHQSHPTAEEILSEVTQQFPGIGLATVYNIVSALTERGQALTLSGTGGRRYDLRIEPHQHIRCRQCGCLADLPEWVDGHAWSHSVVPEGWASEGVSVTVEGWCPVCRRVDHVSR